MSLSLTKKELANVAGYTYRRLYDIDRDLPENRKLFVEGEGGKYDLAVFVQRWVEYNVAQESGDVDDLDTVKARHEAVKIEKTELEVARLRGELIAVQDVKKLWGDVAKTIMQNMLHLPNKVAPLLRMMESTERIAGILDNEIRTILNALADTPLPDYAADEEDEESDGDDA